MKRSLLLPLALVAMATRAQTEVPTLAQQLEQEEQAIVITDGTFREYRLAVLLTHEEFRSEKFGGDTLKVYEELKKLERYLNSIYVRDLGVKFTILLDERLIADDLLTKYADSDNSTEHINERIGADSYDVGLTMNYWGYDTSARAGLATLAGIKWEFSKGAVMSAKQEDRIVAHELGHLMGANHTFYTGSEPGSGQSIVGYGFSGKVHFVSLASLQEMTACLKIADKRTSADLRTVADNTPPRIDRNRMPREITVPKNTFFTIPVHASDAEQDSLYYCFNQWNYLPYAVAHFPTYAPSRDSVLTFGRVYGPSGAIVPGSDDLPVGDYKMLISVSDALPIDEAIEHRQAPLYDNYLMMVHVVDAVPFKMTTEFGRPYDPENPSGLRRVCSTGERFTLKWDVDSTFFSPSDSVRVLLSADAGQTFPYVLVPATANDGECEVVLPQRPIGEKVTLSVTTDQGEYIPIFYQGQAVMRLEVIGKGFYDITQAHPNNGGTTVDASPITFADLPDTCYVKIGVDDPLPDVPQPKAFKDGRPVSLTYSESTEGHILRRLWVAKDGDDESAYVQWIERIVPEDPVTPPTGITPQPAVNAADAPLYDVTGRRVLRPEKGRVYIQAGRKVVF